MTQGAYVLRRLCEEKIVLRRIARCKRVSNFTLLMYIYITTHRERRMVTDIEGATRCIGASYGVT